MDLTEKTLESREVYRGRILRVREDRVLLPNGQEAQREIVEHPGGVGILALDADGCAVMVRQYRYAFGGAARGRAGDPAAAGERAVL